MKQRLERRTKNVSGLPLLILFRDILFLEREKSCGVCKVKKISFDWEGTKKCK